MAGASPHDHASGTKAGNKKDAKPIARKTKHGIPLQEAVRRSGVDLLLTEGELYLYRDGVWSLIGSIEAQWLKVLIQKGADALGVGPILGTVNAAWKRLIEHPPLYREKVEWDPGSLVAVANGTLDLRTRELSSWQGKPFFEAKAPHSLRS
jgi:hypothetical protein